MTRSLVAAFLALGTVSAAAAPVPKDVMPKEAPYWPTAVGTKWVYLQGGKERSEEITKSEARDGGVRLTIQIDGKNGMEATFDVTKVAVVCRTLGPFTIDQKMLPLPPKTGDSWDYTCQTQQGLAAQSGNLTVGETEDVTVPAGTFRATKVVFTVTQVNGTMCKPPFDTYTYWYAQGVGLVRLEYRGGEKVLKSFTPPRK